jgi:crossover junction endodeoxyribonuclease RusA
MNPTPYQLSPPVLGFQVLGTPAGQGRISFLGKGRPAIHSNQDKLLPWRELVQHAAEKAIAESYGTFPLDGPLCLYACFTLPKAKSAPKGKTTYPTKRPDGSHLLRAVEDAMTNAGVWGDDAQLVHEVVVKVFPGEHLRALHVPGVWVQVHTVSAGAEGVGP